MAVEIKIPVADQTTEEVRVVKWRINQGDNVKKGDIVLEVETDKSIIEVESTGDGVLLKQLFEEDDMVPVGKVVAYVGAEGTEITAEAETQPVAAASASAPVQTPAEHTFAVTDVKAKASPIAKKLAAKLGIDLSQVNGTGPGGKIVKEDVENFTPTLVERTGRLFASPNAKRLARESGIDINQIAGTGPNGRITGRDIKNHAPAIPIQSQPAPDQPTPGTSVTLTKMRNAIGKNLQQSSRDTPHFNVTMSIDITGLMKLRKELNTGRPKEKRISVNDFVIQACANSLRQFPAVNSRLKDNEIHYLPDVNVGVATAVPDGLVVPVLINADKLSLDQIADESKRIVQQGRNGRLVGMGKGTFTISNLGMFGVDEFTAIINPPESAILAVGAGKEQVVVIDQMIAIRTIMKVTLCSDHRMVDGVLAGQFLSSVKDNLEQTA